MRPRQESLYLSSASAGHIINLLQALIRHASKNSFPFIGAYPRRSSNSNPAVVIHWPPGPSQCSSGCRELTKVLKALTKFAKDFASPVGLSGCNAAALRVKASFNSVVVALLGMPMILEKEAEKAPGSCSFFNAARATAARDPSPSDLGLPLSKPVLLFAPLSMSPQPPLHLTRQPSLHLSNYWLGHQ